MNFDLQDYDLTADTPRRINMAGRQFLIVEAAGNLTVHAIRNQSRQGRITGAPQGIAIRSAQGSEGFHGLEVESDQTETIKLAIADDDVDLSSVSSNVTIASPLSGGRVQVLNDDDENGRAPLTNLEGATSDGVEGGTDLTVLTAAANTNGAIIRLAGVRARGDSASSGEATVNVGGTVILKTRTTSAATNDSPVIVKDIFVPAANSIALNTNGEASAWIWWEAL